MSEAASDRSVGEEEVPEERPNVEDPVAEEAVPAEEDKEQTPPAPPQKKRKREMTVAQKEALAKARTAKRLKKEMDEQRGEKIDAFMKQQAEEMSQLRESMTQLSQMQSHVAGLKEMIAEWKKNESSPAASAPMQFQRTGAPYTAPQSAPREPAYPAHGYTQSMFAKRPTNVRF